MAKWKIMARQKTAPSMLTVCSQHAHSMLTNAFRPFKYLQTHVKWQKNTDASWAVLPCSYMVLELSKSFKFIQNHSNLVNFLHLTPDGYLTGYYTMSSSFPPVKLPQIDSNRPIYHHHDSCISAIYQNIYNTNLSVQ